MHACARALLDLGPRAVLLKGGHLEGDRLVDVYADAAGTVALPARRIATRHTHGTGCTLSSAVAALLPRSASTLDAVRDARSYLLGAIAQADRLTVGSGHGPVHHFHALWKETA
jgi:hydroxymethylpyrimidine/phosphomethylpyrimidine kinase